MVVLFYSNLNNLHQCVLKLEQNLHILEKLKSTFMSKQPAFRILLRNLYVKTQITGI